MGRFELPVATNPSHRRRPPREVGCEHLLSDARPCVAGHLCSFCEAELAGVALVRNSDAVAELLRVVLVPFAATMVRGWAA